MNICIFTGGRAEYGLLKNLMLEIKNHKTLKLQLIVSGMHLSPEFGNTYKIIENDGFVIDEKVEMILSSDTPISICKSIGLGMIGYSEALSRLKPDLLVTLGDRYENFSITSCAWTMRIPVAHIQGGETTTGAIDDGFRHAITKLSSLHFTATEEYKKRVLQLGEQPHNTFNVGALNVDAIKKTSIISKFDLEKDLNIELTENTVLVTFHPTTLDKTPSEEHFDALLRVLERRNNLNIIFTKTLADTDGRIINSMIDEFVEKNNERCIQSVSLGHQRYISVLNYIGAVVGNSSSGIIETASIPIATVNIGCREAGRICPDNVINVESSEKSIEEGIDTALSDKFRNSIKSITNPYDGGDSVKKIVKVIQGFKKKNTMKFFYDI
jgi:GDP/UDP-N,N'-diacetylbacillosamine 2-epimerase (hydrolysing)